MHLVKTSSKGQLVIPAELRDKYGLTPGSFVYVTDTGKEIMLSPAPKNPIEGAWGRLEGGKSLSKELIKERKREKRHEKKRGSR